MKKETEPESKAKGQKLSQVRIRIVKVTQDESYSKHKSSPSREATKVYPE
jgi:hypothetical protein